MNIKSSLTIKFTGIVAAILIVFSLFTYEFSEIFRKNEFSDRLKGVSENVVINYLNKSELTPEVLQLMYQKRISRFPGEKLLIADENYEVVFASEKPQAHQLEMLEKLYQEGLEFERSIADTEYISYIIPHNGMRFYVVNSAVDVAGHKKLSFLKNTLILLTIFSIGFSALLGWYFSNQALKPIKEVINQVDTITESSLHQRVSEGNGKDEIADLAIVFNKMLGRIEKSFSFQKMFVANASHEFRTPLTAMKGQIEVLLMFKRSEAEYQKAFQSLLDDTQNLIALINGLTELASANADFPNIRLEKISMVDVIMDAREELSKRKNHFKIQLEWADFPEDEEKLLVKGDYSLLKSILINLMDNACKFSGDDSCKVKIAFRDSDMEVQVINQGQGIQKQDLPHIFEPFYRSNETRHVPGYGIGLSLVKKTLDIHHGHIFVKSEPGEGTTFTILISNYASFHRNIT